MDRLSGESGSGLAESVRTRPGRERGEWVIVRAPSTEAQGEEGAFDERGSTVGSSHWVPTSVVWKSVWVVTSFP